MHIERKMIAVVHDQSYVPPQPKGQELFIPGPEVAWSFDRKAAEMWAARMHRSPDWKTFKVTDEFAEILTCDDGSLKRLYECGPIDIATERDAAKTAVLARLTDEERELLKA